MKKFCIFLCILLVFASVGLPAWADDAPQISVFLNSERVEFPDQEPLLVSDRTLVPLRAIFEAYGCMVEWTDGAAYAACAMPGKVRLLKIREGVSEIEVREYSVVNGKQTATDSSVRLDVPAQNINSRIMVPLRAVSEALGAEVIWNGITESVNIFYDQNKIYDRDRQNEYITQNFVKMQHILLENSTAGREKGEIIIRQIAAGVNFEALMYEHNLDSGVADHPDGYVFGIGEVDQALEDAVFSLHMEEVYAEPVKSILGYHVVKRVALTDEDYETVRLKAIQHLALD